MLLQTYNYRLAPLVSLTWKFHPLVWVANRPDIHHHVHPTSSKVLIIRGPGQTHWFGMMSVELVFYLGEGRPQESIVI